MEFEWDDNKNEVNISKHGIDFADAEIIFEAPLVKKRDKRKEYEEPRWLSLGNLDGTVVVVSYTHRKYDDRENVRIISIRKASQREKEIYRRKLSRT